MLRNQNFEKVTYMCILGFQSFNQFFLLSFFSFYFHFAAGTTWPRQMNYCTHVHVVVYYLRFKCSKLTHLCFSLQFLFLDSLISSSWEVQFVLQGSSSKGKKWHGFNFYDTLYHCLRKPHRNVHKLVLNQACSNQVMVLLLHCIAKYCILV